MTARTRFLGAALALGVLTQPTVGLINRAYHSAFGVPTCDDAALATEARWQGTGAWRPLAPYPAPREASPTRTVGVWIERAHLDHGATELRRVSAAQTDVVSVDAAGCLSGTTAIHRAFNSDSLGNAFTDASLDSLLSTSSRGMIYVWSPRMPLSLNGMTEARAAA
ncbi:MAG: hypothetical protein ABI120_02770, partial [Gemmatimonadaceae bacterium]